MPAMASITVKAYDGTTDVVYDQLSASGGDQSPAVWRHDTGVTAALPVGLRASLKVWGLWNGPKTARLVKFNFVSPYAVQDSTTTLFSAKDRVVADGVITMPVACPASHLNESAARFSNLMGAALMKEMMRTGYAAT